MLNENIKAIRKSKGLSQEELAVKLNVVRQTISNSEVLETPVSTFLGETITEEHRMISKHFPKSLR